MSPEKLSLCKLHVFSVAIIIWNLFVFRRDLELEVERIYTSYWIVVTWKRYWGVTSHFGSGLLILVTTLLSFWVPRFAKVKVKYFSFVTWPLNPSICMTFLVCNMNMLLMCHVSCGWGSLILSHHSARFGVHKPCESGDIASFICHATTWLMCNLSCGWGSLILSHHPARFGVHRPCISGDITSLIWQVTTRLMSYVTCEWGSLILSHDPAKFGVDRPCESRDNVFCSSHDHDIKMSCDIVCGVLSSYVTTLLSLRPIGREKVKV